MSLVKVVADITYVKNIEVQIPEHVVQKALKGDIKAQKYIIKTVDGAAKSVNLEWCDSSYYYGDTLIFDVG